jgi:rhodanese-related sulfurtransferase
LPNAVTNEELEEKLKTNINVLDVRETAVFAFGHILNGIWPFAFSFVLIPYLLQLKKDFKIL